MRKNLIFALALSSVLAGTSAWAQSDRDTSGTTVRSADDYSSGYLSGEVVGIKPQVGTVLFEQGDETTARLVYGATADLNLASSIIGDQTSIFVGPSVGFFYSNLGVPGENNFFGASDLNVDKGNIMVIPGNLKLGWNVSDAFRFAVHGGANIIRRSNTALQLSDTGISTGTEWDVYPNAGADFEFALGRNFGLILRPDMTFTPGTDLFTGTIGFNAIFG